jgi:excinuclease ABC subunit C
MNHTMKNVFFTVPIKGDKRKLLDLSERNAVAFRKDRLVIKESSYHVHDEAILLKLLQQDLRLKKLPSIIECFDNSNIQGSFPVSSCVVFHSGKPRKSEYRHYNIKTVEGPNDFASMEEIIYRRYKRIIAEKNTLPDLVIIDGGKGQLHAALKILNKLQLVNQIEIISIAKRLEEIYVPGDPVPLYLDKNSSSLKLIQRIRDEAHRFSIAHHRKRRSDAMVKSFLLNIKGIGETARVRILSKTGDINELKCMNLEELINVAGPRAGEILYNYFKSGS